MGTDRSRRTHYVLFASTVLKLADPTLSAYHPEIAPVIMALYTEYLCTGHTLKNKLIRKTTIDQYLKEAVEYCMTDPSGAGPTPRTDPRLDLTTGEVHIFISSALKEVKRWEEVPNRRQPLTKQMIRNLKERAKKKHADSLEDSIADWLVCGLHTGFRSVEWAQERDPDKHGFYRADDPKQQIYAVREDDIQFQNKDKRFLKEKTDPAAVLMDITWRIQKNRQNNEKKSFAKNLHDNDFDSVASMQRIIDRARRYGVPSDEPLAVYRRCKGSKHRTYITNASIDRIMKAIARACYDLDDKQVGQYSTHSVRVGAAVHLHAANFSGDKIMERLRWKSNKYMVYLRNIPQLAAQQTAAIHTINIDSFVLE
jgi:hypothetical protein